MKYEYYYVYHKHAFLTCVQKKCVCETEYKAITEQLSLTIKNIN